MNQKIVALVLRQINFFTASALPLGGQAPLRRSPSSLSIPQAWGKSFPPNPLRALTKNLSDNALGVFFLGLFLLPAVASAQTLRDYYENGDAHFQKGDYSKAVEFYEKAIELDPNFAPAYNALGLAHQASQDKLADVIWFYKVAVDIDPNYAEAYQNMCRAYYEGGKHLEAEKSCLKALEVNPQMVSAKLSLAWIYLVGKQQPADAVVYFKQVLERVQSPMIYFGLGMALAENGDRGQVLDIITRLRNDGEDSLAVQLEGVINASALQVYPPPEEAVRYALPENKPGTIIEAQPRQDVFPEPVPQEAETMKIRLRGTLNIPAVAGAAPGQPPAEETRHPGSLSD